MYEKIKDYMEAHCIGIAVAGALILTGILAGVIYDHGGRAGDAGAKLDAAVRNQSDITSRIDGIEKRVDDIGGRIDRSAEAVGRAEESALRIEGSLDEAGSLIADCQRIIAGIRARGEAYGTET